MTPRGRTRTIEVGVVVKTTGRAEALGRRGGGGLGGCDIRRGRGNERGRTSGLGEKAVEQSQLLIRYINRRHMYGVNRGNVEEGVIENVEANERGVSVKRIERYKVE